MGVSGVNGMYGEYGVLGTPAERNAASEDGCGRSRTVALIVERGRSVVVVLGSMRLRLRRVAVAVRRGSCEVVGVGVGVVPVVVVGKRGVVELEEVGVGPRAFWVRSGRDSGAGARRV